MLEQTASTCLTLLRATEQAIHELSSVNRLVDFHPGLDRPAREARVTQNDAAFFARISRELMEQDDDAQTLHHVALGAVDVVPAVDHCGVSLRRRRGRVESVATSSAVAATCDALQYELGEGPCLEAIWESETFLNQDTLNDERWPRWGPRVADHGIRSVLSVRLATGTETLGAINMYAERAAAFTSEDIDLAMIYAVHATNAMSAAQLVSGLQTAVQTRHLIGVAQGVLMTRYGLSLDHSFEVLRRYSSHHNVKLRDLAASVVASGGLPGLDGAEGGQAHGGAQGGRRDAEPD